MRVDYWLRVLDNPPDGRPTILNPFAQSVSEVMLGVVVELPDQMKLLLLSA